MTDLNRSIPTTLSDDDVVALYTERRLADMKRGEAWFYRRYRLLSPRARMFASEIGIVMLVWFALHGIARVLDGVSTSHLVSACIMVAAITIGSLIRTIPFPYR